MPTLTLCILDLKWVAVPNWSTTYSIQYMITEGGPTSCDHCDEKADTQYMDTTKI